MPAKNRNLHGSVPDHSRVALLLIDVLNAMEFPEAKTLARQAKTMAPRLAALKQALKNKGIPVIYANDNFGRWKSEKRELIERCTKPGSLGKKLAEALLPADDDYFVLKPKQSAFFSTTLDTLLRYLGVETLAK